MKDYHLVLSSVDLLVCERYPLKYRPPLMHTADGRGITIMVLTFLNLRKDSHYCILRCVLLFEFWTLGQINWTLPCPWLKCEGFFVWKEKKLLLRRLRGVDEGLSPLYLRCLGIWNNACISSTGLYSKAYNQRFLRFLLHHSPSKSFSKKLVLQCK